MNLGRKTVFIFSNILVLSVASLGIVLSFQNCSGGFSTKTDPLTSQSPIFTLPGGISDPFHPDPDLDSNPIAPDPVGPLCNRVNPTPSAATRCPATPDSHEFKVIADVSSNAVYSYGVRLAMDINVADLTLKKFAFLVGEFGSALYIYSPAGHTWSPYSSTLNMTQSSLELPSLASQFPYVFYSFENADLVALGGSKIYSGYGVGSTPDAAFAEMLSFRDIRHSGGRFDLVYEVPKQGHAVNIQMNSQTSPEKVSGTASVFVRFDFYNQKGFFFFAAQDPSTGNFLLYNGSSWLPSTSNSSASGLTDLTNRTLSMSADVSLKSVAGWKLFAGYGRGATSQEAFQDLLTNNLYNQNPYIIPNDSTPPLNSTNWSVSGSTSGSPSSLSVKVSITVADADRSKKGYQFMVAMIPNEAGPIPMVFNVNAPAGTNPWVRWDGVLASLGSSVPLISTPQAGIQLASQMDVVALGGTKIYAGYGIGDSIGAAATEMMTSSRFREIYSIPQQAFRAETIIPSFSASSPANVTITFRIYPSYLHYGQPGRYYVGAIAPDGTIFFYTGTQWLKYDGNSDPETLCLRIVTSLSNFETTLVMAGNTLGGYAGYRLTAGYGLSFNDFMANSRWGTPVTIQPTP